MDLFFLLAALIFFFTVLAAVDLTLLVGKEEYLIFTKSTQGEELQILVFGQLEDGHYGLLETIDCKGSSFEQVQYASVDDSPGSELIVGTQLNE